MTSPKPQTSPTEAQQTEKIFPKNRTYTGASKQTKPGAKRLEGKTWKPDTRATGAPQGDSAETFIPCKALGGNAPF